MTAEPTNRLPTDTRADCPPNVEPAPVPASRRTLLLAPPSLAAHEEKLREVFKTFNRSATDLQMLDRLSIVALPPATYDLVLLLTDLDGSRRSEVLQLLSRHACTALIQSMKVGAELKAQDGHLGISEAREAVLAGLVAESGSFVKPDDAEEAVPLRLKSTPVTLLDLLDDGDDDDLIDEESLIPDAQRPVFQPIECQPKPGKPRKACKGCTCGLSERLAAKSQHTSKLVLKSEELNELDFTVQGKSGSCGNCSLGDAFRCASCPYMGLPRFAPGEEVKLLNDVPQL